MQPARFVWYELMTSDIAAALAFYGRIIGWTSNDHPGGGERYAIVNAASAGIGGVMRLPEGMQDPFWIGYIGTPNVQETVTKFTQAGGQVRKGPWHIPGVGHIAMVADPQQVALAFIQPEGEGQSQAFDQAKPGHGNWHELHTPNPEAALDFYTTQFGWSKGETHDMGHGNYQIIKSGTADIGGIVKAFSLGTTWIYYFGHTNIAKAAQDVPEAGGTVLYGPSPIPGGAHILMARDPQGAAFALVGPGG